MHHIVHAATLPEAYHQALMVLNDYGNVRPCPAYNTREKSVSITIDIARPLAEPRISKLIPCGPTELQQYLMEMEDGVMDFEYTVAGNWPYTYHNRMIEQLIDVVHILRKDINSRRAVVRVSGPNDIYMEDPPCLQLVHYIVNDGALDCYVNFRSNDAVKAFFMNAFALIDIQRIIAELLEIHVGRYIHTADSFHAYENDWEKLENFTSRIRLSTRPGTEESLAIRYDEEWYGMMIDAVPDIFKKVDKEMKKYGQTQHGIFVGELKTLIEAKLKEDISNDN